jgi:hypothetical protein
MGDRPQAEDEYGHKIGTVRTQNTAKSRFAMHIIAMSQPIEFKGFFRQPPFKSKY